nr:MAG TPA: hypothetical protein [Bacteriophage sp.]
MLEIKKINQQKIVANKTIFSTTMYEEGIILKI